MNEEAAFLARIRQSPGDTTARLVYADWLQERDDSRAELIRVEDELEHLSVFAPTYLARKQVRDQLRARCTGEWLAAMSYGSSYQPMFTALPAERATRWKLADRFVDFWHSPIGVGDAYTVAELEVTEARLGRGLPAALREWYSFAGKRPDIWSLQDRVIPLEHLQIADGELLVRIENQGCCRWFIREHDLSWPDPPVYGGEGNRLISPTLSAFALFVAVYEAKFSRRAIWCHIYSATSLRDHVLRGMNVAALPRDYWFSDQITFWEGDDVIVEYGSSGGDLYAAARTEAAYQDLFTRTGGRLERYG